jgi:hypothetical protein
MKKLENKEKLKRIEKIFPDYFKNFELPAGAREESIKVYRACRSGKCDKDSFLPSFEQNGFRLDPLFATDDPIQYSLSTYEKPKDVKRFADVDSDMKVPYKIAIGETNPVHGLVQRTKERSKKRTSHVDWWLYESATPYDEFELIEDFESYLKDYNQKRVE